MPTCVNKKPPGGVDGGWEDSEWFMLMVYQVSGSALRFMKHGGRAYCPCQNKQDFST